jgi:hypothetical protein
VPAPSRDTGKRYAGATVPRKDIPLPLHTGLIAETINFLGGVPLAGRAQSLAYPIAQWLDEISISPAVETALSKLTTGTDAVRKTRRAMLLILAALRKVNVRQAREAADVPRDAEVDTALARMLLEVERVCLPGRLGPVALDLLGTPATFLATTRIKTGSGSLNASGTTPFELSWNPVSQIYSFDAPNNAVDRFHVTVPGCYNIAATRFSTIGNLAQINGAVVQGNLGLTTQLSGCSILYSVNGGNLVVAHVWPDDGALVKTGLPPAVALAVNAADPAGVVLTLRMAHEGDLANRLAGGTFGIFGMVNSVADIGPRSLGPNNVRTHGYADTLGNAYFVAVLIAGNWQLFGQQSIVLQPNLGVRACQRLYP